MSASADFEPTIIGFLAVGAATRARTLRDEASQVSAEHDPLQGHVFRSGGPEPGPQSTS